MKPIKKFGIEYIEYTVMEEFKNQNILSYDEFFEHKLLSLKVKNILNKEQDKINPLQLFGHIRGDSPELHYMFEYLNTHFERNNTSSNMYDFFNLIVYLKLNHNERNPIFDENEIKNIFGNVLLYSCINGYIDVVRYILKNYVGQFSEDTLSNLFRDFANYSIINKEIVKILILDERILVNKSTKTYLSIIFKIIKFFIEEKNDERFEYFLNRFFNNPKLDDFRRDLLYSSIDNQYLFGIQKCLNKYDIDFFEKIIERSGKREKYNPKIFDLILKHAKDVDTDKIYFGKFSQQAIKKLINHPNIDLSKNDNSVLIFNYFPDDTLKYLFKDKNIINKKVPFDLINQAFNITYRFNKNTIKYLLKHNLLEIPDKPSIKLNEFFINSCKYGIDDLFDILIDYDSINPSLNENKPLRVTSFNKHKDIVYRIINHKEFVPNSINSIIEQKASSGDIEIIKLLLNNEKIKVNSKNKAITIATKYKRYDVVKLLLEDGRINPTIGNNKALKECEGDLKMLNILLSDQRVKEKVEKTKT